MCVGSPTDHICLSADRFSVYLLYIRQQQQSEELVMVLISDGIVPL